MNFNAHVEFIFIFPYAHLSVRDEFVYCHFQADQSPDRFAFAIIDAQNPGDGY